MKNRLDELKAALERAEQDSRRWQSENSTARRRANQASNPFARTISHLKALIGKRDRMVKARAARKEKNG